MTFLRLAVLLLCALWMTGCATVSRGTHESVVVNTEPAGAVVTSDMALPDKPRRRSLKIAQQSGLVSYGCPATPCEFEVPRKANLILQIEKPGFEPVEIGVQSGLSKSALSANLAGSTATGIAGGAVGAATVSSLVGTGIGSGALLGTMATATAGVGVATLGVDAATGALYVLAPNPISITLPPEGTVFEPHPAVAKIQADRQAATAREQAKDARIKARREKFEAQFRKDDEAEK